LTIERTLQAAGDGSILLALSGGGDSVALLHVLAERVGPARLRALVVDHALREGSAADAARAAAFARALGVSAEIKRLSWDQPGPAAPPPANGSAWSNHAGEGAGGPRKRSQEAARRQRYVALCDAARTYGARVIAVAHTADDQAETVFMRAAKGSGWRGLAGMAEIAPAPVWPEGRGVLLARPLLQQRRHELRDMLRARRAEWIEDPANANAVFERVRIRARLAQFERSGFDPMRFARLAAQLRALVDQIDAEAAALVARAARFEGPDIIVDLDAWRAPSETRRRGLSALIAAGAGAEREPSPAMIARLETRIAEPSFRGAALGGAHLRRRGGAFHISRDRGAVEGRAGVAPLRACDLSPNESVWDGRLALSAARPMRLIPGAQAPRIACDGAFMPLADAVERGLVAARWLTELHVIHQLGPLGATKPGF
jgi:tRNA(Ile)-lysidine synthase